MQQESNNKNLIIIALFVVSAIGLIIIILLLMNRPNNSGKENLDRTTDSSTLEQKSKESNNNEQVTDKIVKTTQFCTKKRIICFTLKEGWYAESKESESPIQGSNETNKHEKVSFYSKNHQNVGSYSYTINGKGAAHGFGGSCQGKIPNIEVVKFNSLPFDNLSIQFLALQANTVNKSIWTVFAGMSEEIPQIKQTGSINNLPCESLVNHGIISKDIQGGQSTIEKLEINNKPEEFSSKESAIEWLKKEENQEIFEIFASATKK